MGKFIWIALLFFVLGCSKTIPVWSIVNDNQLERREAINTGENHCYENLSYAPDSNYYTQIIRVNIHFMDDSSMTKNFSMEAGKKYVRSLIYNANERLRQNHKMNLPVGNKTPALFPYFQYKITPSTNEPGDDGFYRHLDNDDYYFLNKGRYRNNYSKTIIKKYAINADSILNIFILPHHPDSVKSKTYSPTATGIAIGTSLKMAGLYERKDKPWTCATLLNHEIGHILGLPHSWLRHDGCDDTPEHPNCWEPKPEGKCAGVVSNNMMDYNNSQMAITPCQLGIIHKGFARERSKTRKLIEKQWCTLDTTKTITISDTVQWFGARDLKHNITITKSGRLEVYCRLSLPKGGSIYIEDGGKLALHNAKLHNDCGDTWAGLLIQKMEAAATAVEFYGKSSLEDVSQD